MPGETKVANLEQEPFSNQDIPSSQVTMYALQASQTLEGTFTENTTMYLHFL